MPKDSLRIIRETETVLRNEGVVHLVGAINDESASICCRRLMAAALILQGSKQPIHLMITSGGGDVQDGRAIMETIFRVQSEYKVPVHTHVMGYAYSMATFIHQAGSFRTMGRLASLMFHGISFQNVGEHDTVYTDEKHRADFERKQMTQLMAYRTGYRDARFWKDFIWRAGRREYVYAATALEMGLIDMIDEYNVPSGHPTGSPANALQLPAEGAALTAVRRSKNAK